MRCIEARARALQGWRPEVWVERLRTQRYRAGGHYAQHFGWSNARGGGGCVSRFMVWVDEGSGSSSSKSTGSGEKKEGEKLEGGGTESPLLRTPENPKRCHFVQCSKSNFEPERGERERRCVQGSSWECGVLGEFHGRWNGEGLRRNLARWVACQEWSQGWIKHLELGQDRIASGGVDRSPQSHVLMQL